MSKGKVKSLLQEPIVIDPTAENPFKVGDLVKYVYRDYLKTDIPLVSLKGKVTGIRKDRCYVLIDGGTSLIRHKYLKKIVDEPARGETREVSDVYSPKAF